MVNRVDQRYGYVYQYDVSKREVGNYKGNNRPGTIGSCAGLSFIVCGSSKGLYGNDFRCDSGQVPELDPRHHIAQIAMQAIEKEQVGCI